MYTDIDRCPRSIVKEKKNKLQIPVECYTISASNCVFSIISSDYHFIPRLYRIHIWITLMLCFSVSQKN